MPIPGTGRERNQVLDAGDVLSLLRHAQVDIVLGGHRHVPYVWPVAGMFHSGGCSPPFAPPAASSPPTTSSILRPVASPSRCASQAAKSEASETTLATGHGNCPHAKPTRAPLLNAGRRPPKYESPSADAADIFKRMGGQALAARMHMLAATTAIHDSRTADARAHAEVALEFYEKVGASLYAEQAAVLPR